MVNNFGFNELMINLREELSNIKSSSEQVVFEMKPIYDELVTGSLDEGKMVKYVDFIYLYTSLIDYTDKVDKTMQRIGKAYAFEMNMNNNKIAKLESELFEKTHIIDNLINRTLDNNQQELISEMRRVLDLVEDNIKVISTSVKMKKKGKVHTAEANPHFKNYAPSDFMVELYNAGMGCREIASRYGMTENGVRERLKKLGVYKPRQYKKSII